MSTRSRLHPWWGPRRPPFAIPPLPPAWAVCDGVIRYIDWGDASADEVIDVTVRVLCDRFAPPDREAAR